MSRNCIRNKQLVVIDKSITDFEFLLHRVPPGMPVLLVEQDQDGLEQLRSGLEQGAGLDALHILSHGQAGRLRLGNTQLDVDTLAHHGATLQALKGALREDGEILLYGCNVGLGEAGAEFVAQLAARTGARIAASDDPTGAADRGGDWDLEVRVGTVRTPGLRFPDYAHTLDDFADDTSTTGSVLVGWYSTGNIELANDKDWFKVWLDGGISYQIDLKGAYSGSGTLSDPYLFGVYNKTATLLPGTTDNDSGPGNEARVTFTAPGDGFYRGGPIP